MLMTKLKEYLMPVYSIFCICIVWIVLFYVASHVHMRFCTPTGVVGFLMTPFVVMSPHCQGLRWLIYNGGNSIVAMWFILSAWIMRYLVPIRNIQ